ncbi:hypothetical protein [Crocosphaera sp.]|uniref:hypothetical protein n=1 Tax=Crocosphaera sp. TaxID=2729996 RepID=UPI002620C32F|nr:hypothetical protein [Crocosphaera sp.]MDJ0581946.1 hypothetical protein [Crocosphaera sp.]
MIQDTVILNKFHQLTPEQQQQMLDFMDFLLFKKEIKDDTSPQIKSKPALAGTQPFEFLATPEESGIPVNEWNMEHFN